MYICSNVFEVYFYQLIFLLFLLADIPIICTSWYSYYERWFRAIFGVKLK